MLRVIFHANKFIRSILDQIMLEGKWGKVPNHSVIISGLTLAATTGSVKFLICERTIVYFHFSFHIFSNFKIRYRIQFVSPVRRAPYTDTDFN